MEIIVQYWNTALEWYGPWGLGVMALAVVLFAIQMRYYIGIFRKLPGFKIRSRKDSENYTKGISVVLAMGDDFPFLENTLPLLLGQDCELFEVVMVYLGNNGEFAEALETLETNEPRLTVSRVKQHALFPINTKMALNIGIKAARYDNIVVTTADSMPASERWLSLMEKGFEKGEIVIGYCGIERRKGLADKIIRSSRMFSSMLYITAAIRRRPYRGTIQNLGFSKNLYFENKGFGHLNLNLGEDDLFLQRIFTKENYTIVMHPRATVRQARWGGLGWWLRQCRLRNHAYPFYPRRTKNFIGWEASSRALFFAAVIATVALLPMHFEILIAAASLVVLRFAVVLIQMGRVARRLGEGGLLPLYFLNDFFEPLFALGIVLSRKIRPIKEVWR